MQNKLIHNKFVKNSIIFGFWIVMWQGLCWFVDEPLFLAGPADTLRCLFRLLALKNTYTIVLWTMMKIATGFLVSLVCANMAAFLAWRFRWVREGLAPFLAFLKSVPIASIIILCLAWFSSEKVSVFIAGFVAFPMVYFEMLSALDGIDQKIMEVLFVYCVTPWRRFRYVYLPAMCDRMVEIARISVGMCIRAGVAAELIGVPSHSLGEMLYKSKIYLEIADLFAWTLLIVVVGYALEKLMIGLVRLWDDKVVHHRRKRKTEADRSHSGAEDPLESVDSLSPSGAPQIPAIRMENISKFYGEQKIIEDFDLTINPGDTVFVTGPSGIGKTTLLRIILGLEKSSTGVVKYNLKRFSTVFQEERLLEQFDITDNIHLVADCTMEAVRREFIKILPEDAFFKRVQEYSGGMKRRAAILRALLSDSPVIFMDEPFKGLDEESKEKTMQYVKERKQNRILLIITHDRSEAEFFHPDKVIRLS